MFCSPSGIALGNGTIWLGNAPSEIQHKQHHQKIRGLIFLYTVFEVKFDISTQDLQVNADYPVGTRFY
jgi:hypothetical protein